MKLPNQEKAVIAQAKVVDYLLSPTHRSGRSKAAFFTRFGFSRDSWVRLVEALQQHAHDHELTRIEPTPFGTRYVIEGGLQTPAGRTPIIRAVWFVDEGENFPRFVTAYPLKSEEGEEDDQGT